MLRTLNFVQIVCVQPHRVATLSIAERVSKEMGVNLGDEVWYFCNSDVSAIQIHERFRAIYLPSFI